MKPHQLLQANFRAPGRLYSSLRVFGWGAAGVAFVAVIAALVFAIGTEPSAAQIAEGVDTALVISVDVSNSVDDRRYELQMQGIAAALEDKGVVSAILNGPRGSILVMLVTWSDRPDVALPWMRISSQEEARAVAQKIRSLPRFTGEFTCVATMLRFVNDKILPQVPVPAFRTVVDVSGDGADNCNSRVPATVVRDEIASFGTTINGLPILVGPEAATLENWYRNNVMAGPGSFILPADGFEDFGRAIRQKFIVEISSIGAGKRPVDRGPPLVFGHAAATASD